MEKLHLTRKMGMVLLAMVMLWPVACKRDQLPPGNSLLNTYRGTDKMVLKVIETLREPANQTVLADLEMQGNINWEYETLITSRFLKGYTLRFATGSDGNYLDAEVNAETGAVKLFSKQMQQQRDALSKQELNSQLLKQGNGTLSHDCTYTVFFEIECKIEDSLDRILALTSLQIFGDLIRRGGFKITEVEGLKVTFTGNNESTTNSVIGELQRVMTSLQLFFNSDGYKFGFKTLEVTGGCESGSPVVQMVPPIIWEQIRYVNVSGAGACIFQAENLKIYCLYAEGNGFWRVQIKSITGGGYAEIRMANLRDAFISPPSWPAEAQDAVIKMKGQFERGAAQGWHTEAASKAHENYHYLEWKAAAEYYWPIVAACINAIKVPKSGNRYNDEALLRAKVRDIQSVFENLLNNYKNSLDDGPRARPYAAGQMELNKAIRYVQQLASQHGWQVEQGVTNPNVDLSRPAYLPFPPFNCPF